MAQEFVDNLDNDWPSQLCSLEQAKMIGFKLDVKALERRFERLAKDKPNMQRIRDRAIRHLQQSGQLCTPPPGMSLWTYFTPAKNTVVTKAALGKKDAAIRKSKAAKRQTRRAAAAMPPPEPTPTAPRRSPRRSPVSEEATLDTLMAPSTATPSPKRLPGLKRGTEAGFVGLAARGRGGKIQTAFKVGIAELVTEDHVPIRDVPKVVTDMLVTLTQKVPKEEELITHSKISGWICNLASAEMLKDWADFWDVRREFPTTVLHIGHDGTRRTDRRLGRHGELMQFRASYFNPRLSRAVSFLVSLRFTVGGSAEHTARALAVCLQDGGVYRCKSSANPKEPFSVEVLQKDVVFDLIADNTRSALNVSPELAKLSKEPVDIWPCPTHINALDGKTPVQKLARDDGADRDKGKGFDARSCLNIADKWWYLCDKHWELIDHWWPKFNCRGKASSAKLAVRPLMGKWESMGAGNGVVYNHADDIRRFVLHMEYYATGMTGVGSLKKDCTLLVEWMHDPEVWFHFLICHDWFVEQIDPTFEVLRKRSVLFPESGCFLGRQSIPRIALDAVCRAAAMPGPAATDSQIDAAVKKYFPNAHKHVHLSADSRPSAAVGGWSKFEIPSQDRLAYLRDFATEFVPQLRTNADKHWRPFLQGWKAAALVTDPEVGAYSARVLVKLLSGSAQLGGEPSALGLANTPQLNELDNIARKDGAMIAATLASEGLFNSPARRADWKRLCSPEGRIDLDWSRQTLPELAPWFEARFFGGAKCNYPLEAGFSTVGQHVKNEQSSELKEAITNITMHNELDRKKRKHESMRVPKKSKKAKANYDIQRRSRADAEESEDLKHDSENRKQLLSRAATLLERMVAAEEKEARECPEIGLTASAFRKRRNLEWDKLFKREACALEGEMRAKRAKGRAKLNTDGYGRVRTLMRKRREASYLEKAEALAAAEKAMEDARVAVAAAAEAGDASDEEMEAPSPKKQRGAPGAK